MRTSIPAEIRFWAKVAIHGPSPSHVPELGPCWIWTGAKMKSGRPNFKVRSYETIAAYRYSYELLVGPIPKGLDLDHLCRQPLCVNPIHLEPVTRLENLKRISLRTHCPQGHLYDEKNTHTDKMNTRHCRVCDAARHYAKRYT